MVFACSVAVVGSCPSLCQNVHKHHVLQGHALAIKRNIFPHCDMHGQLFLSMNTTCSLCMKLLRTFRRVCCSFPLDSYSPPALRIEHHVVSLNSTSVFLPRLVVWVEQPSEFWSFVDHFVIAHTARLCAEGMGRTRYCGHFVAADTSCFDTSNNRQRRMEKILTIYRLSQAGFWPR